MKPEFLQNFKVGDAPLPKEVIDAILAENGRDVEGLRSQVSKLTQDLKDKEAEHAAKLADLAFDGVLKEAIAAAGGRSGKAIRALLDLDKLKAAKDQPAGIKAALEELKKDSGYLFHSSETPPPYAAGTGTGGGQPSAGLDAIRSAAGLSTGEHQ